MSHQRTASASSASSTGTDISMESDLSNRTVSTDSEASVAAMLTQSVSTLSDVSVRTDHEGGLLPLSNAPSRDGSMESIRSVMSINDIIKPEQQKSIQQILLDIQAHSTPTLIHLANKGLIWLSQQDPATRQLSSPSRIDPAKRVDSHRLIAAMLEYIAEGRPKRYVAAAIVTCGRDIDQFIRLANTWFGLFMWPFRENTRRTVERPSVAATPTAHITATQMGVNTIQERTGEMRAKECFVIARDDYRCAVAGVIDWSRPAPLNDEEVQVTLDCAHILKRSVGIRSGETDDSSVSLFDILNNMFPFMAARLESLGDELDSPANGMMLEPGIHNSFDLFAFCLIPWPKDAPEPNTYKPKILRGRPFAIDPTKIIVFEDNSHKYMKQETEPVAHNHNLRSGRNQPPPAPGVRLPDPHFLEIHAAVAHILHMSGAAEFISLIQNQFGDSCPGLFRPTTDPKQELDILGTTFASLDLEEQLQRLAL